MTFLKRELRMTDHELAGLFKHYPTMFTLDPRHVAQRVFFLLKDNQTLHALLTDKGVKHTYVETAGNHSWPVWRRYLAEFAPLVFQ